MTYIGNVGKDVEEGSGAHSEGQSNPQSLLRVLDF